MRSEDSKRESATLALTAAIGFATAATQCMVMCIEKVSKAEGISADAAKSVEKLALLLGEAQHYIEAGGAPLSGDGGVNTTAGQL